MAQDQSREALQTLPKPRHSTADKLVVVEEPMTVQEVALMGQEMVTPEAQCEVAAEVLSLEDQARLSTTTLMATVVKMVQDITTTDDQTTTK